MSYHLAYLIFCQSFCAHVFFLKSFSCNLANICSMSRLVSTLYPHPSFNNITFIIMLIIIEEMRSRDNYLQEYMFCHIAINYLSIHWRLQSIVPRSDNHYCLSGAHAASFSVPCSVLLSVCPVTILGIGAEAIRRSQRVGKLLNYLSQSAEIDAHFSGLASIRDGALKPLMGLWASSRNLCHSV